MRVNKFSGFLDLDTRWNWAVSFTAQMP